MNNIIEASSSFQNTARKAAIPGSLKHFIGSAQMACLRDALRGEEAEAFSEIILRLASTVETMPKTYETDGQGDAAIAHLHYFTGSCDWYVTEKDMEPGPQLQAFGLAKIHEEELGYISIAELIANGAELDFYFEPKPLSECRESAESPAPQQDLRAEYPQLTPVEGSGKAGFVIGAANLRKMLKAAFPGVKFSVRSDSFSMGNSISVSWTDGPTTQQVEKISSRFQYGSFNGQEDIYEYARSPFCDMFGGSKYVSESRHISDEAMKQVAAEMGHDPETVNTRRMELPDSADSEIFRRKVWERDFTEIVSQKPQTPTPAVQEKVAEIEPIQAVKVIENTKKNGVEIHFAQKPQEFLLNALKQLGWKWSRAGACWYHRRTEGVLAFARNLAASSTFA